MGAIGTLALVLSALFAGAAIYVSAVEHPARMKLDAAHALAQWRPSYHRGAFMQASLAMLAGLAGLAAWWSHGGALWLIGSLLMLANWPWTLIVIMPVNRQLKADPGDEAGALLDRWARLHSVRTVLGSAATLAFAAAVLGRGAM